MFQPRSAGARGRSLSWIAGLGALLLAATGAHAQVFGPEPVGSSTVAQTVTVTATTAGTASSVEVVTQGETGMDFASGTGASTCGTATLALHGTCTESVTFTPSAPGLRAGAVVVLGTVGGVKTVLGMAYLSGTGNGPLGVLSPGNVLPVAGQYDTYLGSVEDGKQATAAVLYLPTGEAVDGAGNLYIADSLHNRVRMVCASATSALIEGTSCTARGIISTIAGNGDPGYSGNGPAASSTLNDPSGVAVDGAGNLYIADAGNNVVREIVAATGEIVTVAGGSPICLASTDTYGDGCPATEAILNGPLGVTLDVSGDIYIADTSDELIRAVSVSTGVITTVAGTGYTNPGGTGGYNGDNIAATGAELNSPYTVAFDALGNMYIPDSLNNRIRLVTAIGGSITAASKITTFAGNGTQGYKGDGGAAASAELWAPSGVAVDAAGNVYIADTQNQAIRKVNSSTGDINTLVKANSGTFYFNNIFSNMTFYGPIGLCLDGSGDLYVADTLDMVVREIQGNYVALQYKTAVRQDAKSTAEPVTIENDGNEVLDLTAITPAVNAEVDPVTTTCITGPPDMSVSGDCVVGAIFAPTVSANPLDTNIDVTSVTPNSPLDIELVGNALAVNSTTTAVGSNPNPSGFGQTVTFTVTVTTGTGTGALTGTVNIVDTFNGVAKTIAQDLGVNPSGVATFQISTLPVGQHSIVADYSGDSGHFSSMSTDNGVAALIQTVLEATKTLLTSSVNPSTVGQNVTFTATVSVTGGGTVTPDGTVTFMDGATTLATVPLTAGVATYATATLTIGVHPITAVYSGDTTNQIVGSTSAILKQDVQSTTAVTLTPSLNPSTFGTSVTFTATITSGATTAATGTVTFLDGTTKIGTGTLGGTPDVATFTTTTLSVGTHPITVTYAGDANNGAAASAPPLSQVVTLTPTTTTEVAKPNPGVAGEAVAITATIKVSSGTTAPTGTVTFTSGTTTLGTATVSGGAAIINPVLAAGTYQVIATYSGDTNYNGSASAATTLTVNLAAPATTLVVTPNPAPVTSTITFTATVTGNGVTPTGTVTFLSGTNTLGTGTLVGGAATFTISTLAVGNYSITASYGGDTDNSPSTSAVTNLVVELIPTTTDLVTSATSGQNPQVILVSVVTGTIGPTPTGTVTFKTATATLGTATLDASGVATFTPNLPNGNYSVVAVYSGDTMHSPSTSAAVSITGAPAGFSLTVTPATLTLAASQNGTLQVNLTSDGGFTDTIGLGCASLPAQVTCTFSSPSVTLAANGTATAQLTIDTNSPLSGGAAAMNSRGAQGESLYMAGLLLPLSALFGWIFWRLRKRNAGVFTMIVVLALSAGALLASGCGGYSSSKATAGTYVIQVTGTGTNSNVIHYQNVTLDITN
jgi:hypothetical protein